MAGRTDDFCSFTKAVEHLGDRWSFLIIREIYLHGGSRGFNALAATLPGISRSVLARRLRKLEAMGVIAREASVQRRPGPYRLAPAGQQLLPTLLSFSQWADRWVPDDPAAAQHDPEVITFWLTLRIDPPHLPDTRTVLAFDLGGARSVPSWLVLERGSEPSLCVEDPLLPAERYVHVEADAAALYPIARGQRGWQAAISDRSVRLYGDPGLIRELPGWFLPAADRVGRPLREVASAALPVTTHE